MLDEGSIARDDRDNQTTELYLHEGAQEVSAEKQIEQLANDPTFKLSGIYISQNGDVINSTVKNGIPFQISIHYEVKQEVSGLRIFIDVLDNHESVLFRTFHDEGKDQILKMRPGSYISTTVIPAGLLSASRHILCIKAGIFSVRYTLPESGIRIPLDVEQTSTYNRAYPGDRFVGQFALVLNWETSRVGKKND